MRLLFLAMISLAMLCGGCLTTDINEGRGGIPGFCLNGAIGEDPLVFFFAPHSILQPDSFDDQGIPMQQIGGELHYSPTQICQRALAFCLRYAASKNPDDREQLLALANWLVVNAIDHDGAVCWPYFFDYPAFNCRKPWSSAMAQGLALVVLHHNGTKISHSQAAFGQKWA